LQWISALQQAIGLSDCEQSHQRTQAAKRRKQRELESASQNEEIKRRNSQVLDIELARAQLEAEKTVSFCFYKYVFCILTLGIFHCISTY
jgi:hypothetical protein